MASARKRANSRPAVRQHVTRSQTQGKRTALNQNLQLDRKQQDSAQEFPVLEALGLYAAEVKADGNCLFRALSDQLYGDSGAAHVEIRAAVVEYMRKHADFFQLFLGSADSGESWDHYIDRMSSDGVYGDNPEIVAFANRFEADIVIYQHDNLFIVRCSSLDENHQPKSSPKECHIAYHTWEHYSSVRNHQGPHAGLPNVKPRHPVTKVSSEPGQNSSPGSDLAPQWQLNVVKNSLPYPVSDEVASKYLKKYGDIGPAVEAMLLEDVEGESLGGESAEGKDLEQGQESSVQETAPIEAGSDDEVQVIGSNAAAKPLPKAKRASAREKKERQKKEALQRKREKRQTNSGLREHFGIGVGTGVGTEVGAEVGTEFASTGEMLQSSGITASVI